MNAGRLHLIRHAPVINQKGTIYGDNVEFDIAGQQETINKLALVLPSVEHSDWYSSGVERAHQSALSVLKAKNEKIEVIKDTGFREQDFGSLIGKKHEDITDYLNFIDGKIYAPAPPGGESLEVLYQRTKNAFLRALKKLKSNSKKDIVIFTHGGAIRSLHLFLTMQSLENYIDHDTPPLGHHEYPLINIVQ